jgi:hypothetical protein
MTTDLEDASGALTNALARRARHRQRPLVVRAAAFLALLLLLAASAEIWLRVGFLPPLLVPAVVALLALEFAWAARVLAWGLDRFWRFTRAVGRVVRRP